MLAFGGNRLACGDNTNNPSILCIETTSYTSFTGCHGLCRWKGIHQERVVLGPCVVSFLENSIAWLSG